MAVDVASLVHVPAQTTRHHGCGYGLAVCPFQRLLVTSDEDTDCINVFSLRTRGLTQGVGDSGPGDLEWVRTGTLGGESTPAPLQFRFSDPASSGYLAFTGPATARRLLVTDAGHDAVHAIDVPTRAHAGYVAPPGTIAGPRGVAAWGSLAAASVSAWRGGASSVRLFECTEDGWIALRLLTDVRLLGAGGAAGQLRLPSGLRFARDGTVVAVADNGTVTAAITSPCFESRTRQAFSAMCPLTLPMCKTWRSAMEGG